MNNKAMGIALLIAAAVLTGIVFQMRPPTGFSDALMRNNGAGFLKPEVFHGSLVVAAIMAIFGLVKLMDRNADE